MTLFSIIETNDLHTRKFTGSYASNPSFVCQKGSITSIAKVYIKKMVTFHTAKVIEDSFSSINSPKISAQNM